MAIPQNPFHTLYLTEGVGDVDFPSLFSPILVPHVAPLFLPGNVVLKGMQGSGKSMLLSLLDTSVRLQFWRQSQAGTVEGISRTDPLTFEQRRFIGAGINLSKSNAFKLRGVMLSKDPTENGRLACQCFADFVNCWVLRDLFHSLEKMISSLSSQSGKKLLKQIGISSTLAKLDKAVAILSDDPSCPFLSGICSVDALNQTLSGRVASYKLLIMNPRNKLPSNMDESRTILGEPITAAAKALQLAGAVNETTSVIITLDQFETLDRKTSYPDDDERVLGFIRVVDELVAGRERAVSYRIGTRPNARFSVSEASRDYIEIDLDRILQRKEHGRRGKGELFYQLSEDAFRRRLVCSQIPHWQKTTAAERPLRDVFGESPGVAERGELCAPKRRERALKIDKKWPEELRNYLKELARQDVISAKLGEAWVRQQFSRNEPVAPANWATSSAPPWEEHSKKWWKKERLPLAALQVASRNAQRLKYFGDIDIVMLSGENILAFVSICREIWECEARYRVLGSPSGLVDDAGTFAMERQAEGIRDASRAWRDKIQASPDGDTLQRFLDELGRKLHSQLIGDLNMSYPGANGISLAKHDLDRDDGIRRLLFAATAEGFLLQRDHTPKNTSRGKSIKWYPHPILAPYYELTVQHTKEPLYLTVERLRKWLEPQILQPLETIEATPPKRSRSRKTKGSDRQQSLPFANDEGEVV